MTLQKISKQDVNKAIQKTDWDFGNQILYDLCYDYPKHKQIDQIVAKIWLIGRAYAAAVERRKNAKDENESFYIDKVAPTIKNSSIDQWLDSLDSFRFPTLDNIKSVLEVHFEFQNLLKKITGLDKRSLTSKYLHFHKPSLFFIYDSRAIESIRMLTLPAKSNIIKIKNIDPEYAKFCLRCIYLRNEIKERFEIHLTPRQFDNLLLTVE
jgi:hypothetical protein